MSDLLDDLEWRGLVADSTDCEALKAHLAQGPVTFYAVSYTHLTLPTKRIV